MKKLKAIIVEDEEISREILRNYILKYCPSVQIITEASNIDDAEKLIVKNNIDLLFLDVEMPYGNAFDLLDRLPERNFETVFVTAYDHYAIEALNNQAIYYLLKPISIDELIKAVNLVENVKNKEQELVNTVVTSKQGKIAGKLTIPQQDGFEVLNIDEILYCKADDNYTEIYLENNQKKVVSKTLKYFEDTLKDTSFARIHKSYLVNVNAIVKYKKGKGGSVVLSNNKELLVSSSKKSDLFSFFK